MPRPGGKKATGVHRFGQAQVIEHLEDVGAELDAGADLAEGGSLLQHGDRMAVAGQHEGGGQSADAAAGDEEGKRLCHRARGHAGSHK